MADKSARKAYDASSAERSFGANVRMRRTELGVSQEWLAEQMTLMGFPMHQTTITKIESASRPTSVGELHALAYALRVSLADLLMVQSSADEYTEVYELRKSLTARLEQAKQVQAAATQQVAEIEEALERVKVRFRELADEQPAL